MNLFFDALRRRLAFSLVLSVSLLAAQVATAQEEASNVENIVESLEAQANPDALAAIDLYIGGDVDGAYNLFTKVYDSNQDSDPPGVLLALLHSHAGRFLEMRRSLEKTAEDYPTDPEAFLQLAGIDVKEGRYLEAELLLERAERLTEEYPKQHSESTSRLAYLKEEALSARANLAEARGRYETAKEFVQKIVEVNPTNPTARWNLGYLSMKLNDFDGAELAFDEAAKLNSELWPGWLQVPSVLDREDRVEEGKARLASSADKLSAATNAQRAQVARLYLRWNMIEEATSIIQEFETANDENDINRWLLPGWLALYASQYAIAEENFRNATLLDDSNSEASNGLALALLDQNNKEKLARARTIAAKNYRANPDSADFAGTYAWTLFLSGNAKEADAIFQPMLQSGRASATSVYYLAEIANVRGDQSLALNLVNLALSHRSNFPKRAAALELRKMLDPSEEEDEESQETGAEEGNDAK